MSSRLTHHNFSPGSGSLGPSRTAPTRNLHRLQPYSHGSSASLSSSSSFGSAIPPVQDDQAITARDADNALVAARRLALEYNLGELETELLSEFVTDSMPEQLARMFALGLSNSAELVSQRREIDRVAATQDQLVTRVAQSFELSTNQKRDLREAVSHFIAHPLVGYTGRFLLTRLEDYLRVQGGEIGLEVYATSTTAQDIIRPYLQCQIRNLKNTYRRRTFHSVDDEPVSLPRFTIDAVDDLHVGERETAKRSDLVQGHFAHCRLTAHRLIQNPVPTANGDTAFWRTISNDIKQNVKAWGSDRNTPAWRNWSRTLIIEDLAIFPAPTAALQELSQFPGPNANADVAPPAPAPLPIGPPGPLANAMAALPPPQVAPGLWQEIDEALGGEDVDDDAAYDGNNVHLWPQ